MEEKPKSIWTKSWTGPGSLLLAWLALLAAFLIIFLSIMLLMGASITKDEIRLVAAGEAVVTAVVLLVLFIRWVCCLRNLKRLIFGLVCLATLVALFYAEEDWRGKHAWNNYVRECEAAGASMDWSTYIPAQIPDDQNLAMCPLFKPVLDYTKTNDLGHGSTIWNDKSGTERVYRLDVRWGDAWAGQVSDAQTQARRELDANPLTNGWVNLAAWQNYFRTGTNLAGIQAGKTAAEDVLLGMRYVEKDMAELQGEAARRPLGRWPLHYDTDFLSGILLPQLSDIRRINNTLEVRASARLAAGDVEGGLADVHLGLRLADSTASEPFIISLLVREFAVEDILQPVREGIARHQFSDAQLATLQQEFAGEDFLAGYKKDFQAERAMQGQWQKYDGKIWRAFYREMGRQSDDKEKKAWVLLEYAPKGWIYQNQLTLCHLTDRVYRQAVDVHSRQVYPAITKENEKVVDEAAGLYAIITKLVLTYKIMEGAPLNSARHQTMVDQTVIACALERYRLVHGEYPEMLDGLAPQFIAQVPHDVVGGGPLKYHRTDGGRFVLYSIGWNEKDDGGVVSQPDGGAHAEWGPQQKYGDGDWVWEHPM